MKSGPTAAERATTAGQSGPTNGSTTGKEEEAHHRPQVKESYAKQKLQYARKSRWSIRSLAMLSSQCRPSVATMQELAFHRVGGRTFETAVVDRNIQESKIDRGRRLLSFHKWWMQVTMSQKLQAGDEAHKHSLNEWKEANDTVKCMCLESMCVATR